MNRKKALFMHEMRMMRWFLAAGVLGALIFCLMLLRTEDGMTYGFLGFQSWNVSRGSIFSEALLNQIRDIHIYVWIAFAVFTMLQFRDYHRRRTGEYMNSLPFTNRERFVVKALLGYVVIFVSWLVMAVGTVLVWKSAAEDIHKTSLLYSFYKELLANETIWHTLRTLCVFGLELLAAYSLFLLLHSMVSNGGAASLFTLGVMAAPAGLCYVVNDIHSMVTGKTVGYDVWGWEHLARLFAGDALADFTNHDTEWYHGAYNLYVYITYWDMWKVIVVLLLILAVCTMVTWRMSKEYDLAKGSCLVPRRGARIFLSLGIGVCFGSAIAEYFPSTMRLAPPERVIVFFAMLIAYSGILSFVTYKILKKTV